MKRIWVICACALISMAGHAGEKEEVLVAKVISAYGGDKLLEMKTLQVSDRYKVITKGGGRTPEKDRITRLHSKLTVEFETGRKAIKNWRVTPASKRLTQTTFDGKQVWSTNILRGTHIIRANSNGDTVGVGMMRLLDIVLARRLVENKNTAEYAGQVSYNGQSHEKLVFKVNGEDEHTLFIDAESGYISKLERANRQYVFSEYRAKQGVAFASSADLLTGGNVGMITLSRSIDVNPDVFSDFQIPAQSRELKLQDKREMTVNEVSDGVYIAGQGSRASVFVDAGAYYIGAGGLSDINKRLATVNDHAGTDKTLKYQILPEHQGHLSGIDEISELGANFVIAGSHLDALRERLESDLPAERFAVVNSEESFGEGRVRVFNISTLLSEEYLLFYVPSAKLVFAVDEFGTPLLDALPSANKNMMSFRNAIEGLNIDVEYIANIHGPSVMTMQQLQEVTNGYQEGYCPVGHSICAE